MKYDNTLCKHYQNIAKTLFECKIYVNYAVLYIKTYKKY